MSYVEQNVLMCNVFAKYVSWQKMPYFSDAMLEKNVQRSVKISNDKFKFSV
jgi:hypothetical protein